MMADSVLSRLKSITSDSEKVQTELLLSLVRRNADTEYGRKHDFSGIDSLEDYRRRVPLTSWKDYDGAVSRMIAGEDNILTTEKIVYYCISSGLADEPKFIPLTSADIRTQKRYAIDCVNETLDEYFKGQGAGIAEKHIFYIGEFFRTFMANGTMSGVRMGAPYRRLEAKGEIDISQFTAPKEVLFPDELDDLLYMKLRFALADRSVTAIHGIFVNKIVGLFDHLLKNREHYIADIASGKVSEHFEISEGWRDYIEKKLPGDPARANELKNILSGDERGIARKIWPGLQYVCVSGGGIFARYMDRLQRYIGSDTPVHYFVYSTAESNLAVSLEMNKPDRYTLIPDAAFFEFLPVDADRKTCPLASWEVKKGEEYELFVTTLSGLYRYSVQDIVRVEDFYGTMPVISVSYRTNQIMNLADERITTRQMGEACSRLGQRMGTRLTEYCMDADRDGEIPQYIVYIETEMGRSNNDAKCSEVLDEILKEHVSAYRKAREQCRLKEARVISLRRGVFRSFGAYLSKNGYRMEQNRPLKIISTDDQKDFFRKKSSE
ncbi:MAG: GH3 auxin-responsive promoter family protein [Lachnospiraceae bacterium]|nr:GH3 auxin-responsive promoter family protein [Lachnospiraceae bacterium]